MRCLGVDLGDARTGVALSDICGITCAPLQVMAERDADKLVARIVEVAKTHEAAEIVVGLPRPLQGGTNQQLERVLGFVELLRSRTVLRVTTWDERFTSRMASARGRSMRSDDSVAACYMLQNYLDASAGKRGEE